MTENTLPDSPSTQLYTMIRLVEATAIFLAFYLAYAIILLLIKNRISKDFLLSSYAKRFQHIIEALNMPESFEDWDSEHNLDVKVKLYIPSTWKTQINLLLFSFWTDLVVRVKVSKSQKQFFLKLHWPKSDRNFWRISALASNMGQILVKLHWYTN